MSIFLQVEQLTDSLVEPNENVVFKSVIFSTGSISYDNATGIITISSTGIYKFDWWVTTQSTSSTSGVSFSLVTSQGDIIVSNSPTKTGEIMGMGIVEVLTAPVTLSLKNASDAIIYYSVVPMKGSLTVMEANITGPTGPMGVSGATGPTGPTGPAGATGEIPSIEIIPTASRYFYFPPENLDLSSSVTIPAGEFIDDDQNSITEFPGLSINSYNNLYINALIQPSNIYSVTSSSLSFSEQEGTIFAGTPIILEIVQFNVQL